MYDKRITTLINLLLAAAVDIAVRDTIFLYACPDSLFVDRNFQYSIYSYYGVIFIIVAFVFILIIKTVFSLEYFPAQLSIFILLYIITSSLVNQGFPGIHMLDRGFSDAEMYYVNYFLLNLYMLPFYLCLSIYYYLEAIQRVRNTRGIQGEL